MNECKRRRLTRSRRRALDRLLKEYLEVPSKRRAAFLERCNARWPRLAAWLRELISADRGITLTLLDHPLQEMAQEAMTHMDQALSNRVEPGCRLGPWKLLEAAGEGGTGAVYRGERADGAFDKTVAIKLLRLRDAGLGEQLRRECRLLARLEHPSIARLLDAGIDERAGPFLVMEWVEGCDLSDWIAECPTQRQCLDVLMALCEAVDHAHRQFIVHGDIKPANVRIDTNGQVRLLDFGIAHLLGAVDEERPAFGGLTPVFAPPEQHRGERLDACADVWALGVLMAWLLNGGRLPDIDKDRWPLEEPAASGRERHAIIAKATARDPRDRYASAREMLDDLRCYRTHRPLQAMPAGPGYRVRKFLRRNPVLIGGITATASVLVAGLITTAVWYLEARDRAAELASVVDFQARHLSGVDAREMGAAMRRDLLDQRREVLVSSEHSEEEVEAELEALETLLAGVNFTDMALATLDEGIFDRARQTIDQRFDDQPRIHASLLQTLARTLRETGLIEQATEPQASALALRSELLGDDAEETLESLHESGVLAYGMGDFDTAHDRLERSLEHRRRVLGRDHPDTLTSAHELARTLRRLDQLEHSGSLTRETLQVRQKRLGDDHPDTIASQAELAALLRHQGQLEEAEPHYREVARQRRETLGADHPDTLEAMNNLGLLLAQSEHFEEAETIYLETLERRKTVLGEHHPSTLISLSNLAVLMRMTERYDEAEAYYRDNLRAIEVYGRHHVETARLNNNLGMLYRYTGQLDDSEHYLREAIETRRLVYGADHRSTLIAKHNLARTLLEQQRLEEAKQLQARAVDGIKQAVPPDHWFRGAFLGNYGHILMTMEKFEQAESALLDAHEIQAAAFGLSHQRATETAGRLGDLYDEWADHEPGAGHRESRDIWLAKLDEIKREDGR